MPLRRSLFSGAHVHNLLPLRRSHLVGPRAAGISPAAHTICRSVNLAIIVAFFLCFLFAWLTIHILGAFRVGGVRERERESYFKTGMLEEALDLVYPFEQEEKEDTRRQT